MKPKYFPNILQKENLPKNQNQTNNKQKNPQTKPKSNQTQKSKPESDQVSSFIGNIEININLQEIQRHRNMLYDNTRL